MKSTGFEDFAVKSKDLRKTFRVLRSAGGSRGRTLSVPAVENASLGYMVGSAAFFFLRLGGQLFGSRTLPISGMGNG